MVRNKKVLYGKKNRKKNTHEYRKAYRLQVDMNTARY